MSRPDHARPGPVSLARPTTGDPWAGVTGDVQRRYWSVGWRRYLFPGLWMVYLAQAYVGVSHHSSGVGAITGYVVLSAFVVVYLASIPNGWGGHRWFWYCYGLAYLLTAAAMPFAGKDSLVLCVYLAVLTVAGVRLKAMPIVLGLAVATFVLPWVITSWGGHPDPNDAVAVVLVSFAMFGFFGILRSNMALTAARAEVARLAAENERSRIARDLHDLLGHSLTTVTVKSGLARRLAERGDTTRAVQEITEVESLSRRTLGEVRAAVAGYRDVTLSGEVASAREVLRAAGIDATLPGAVDIVEEDASDLFGWVVREGVTNVVRHSRAAHCTITLGPRWIEIVDDGVGATASGPRGNGLNGLTERVEQHGGTLQVGGCARGWRLHAELQAVATEVGAEPVATGTPVEVDETSARPVSPTRAAS